MRILLIGLFLILSSFFITLTITKRTQTRKIELAEMNTLFECQSCGKFHRRYQEELQLRIDPSYKSYLTCPNCYGPAKMYSGKEFAWMNTNPECPELNKQDLKKIKRVINTTSQLQLEDESIEKFLHYYRLVQTKNDST